MTARAFTAKEKRECAEREVRMRRRVYGNRVQRGDMRQETADREIALMEAIAADYAEREKTERLI